MSLLWGPYFLEFKLGQTLKVGLGEPMPLIAISMLEKGKIRLHAVLNFKAGRDLYKYTEASF